MASYITRRVIHALLLLFGISVLSFLFLDLAPGDYFAEARLDPRISAQTVAAMRTQYGLERSLPVRYGRWVQSVWHGDFGVSMAYNLPASQLLSVRIRNTLLLTLAALAITWALGVPLGIWSALRRGRWPDRIIALVTSSLLTIPELLLACAALWFVARSGYLPAGGMVSAGFEHMDKLHQASDILRHMLLPVTVLAAGSLPLLVRHVRAGVIDAMGSSFVVAGRANGIAESRLMRRYVLRSAANPLINLMGLQLGTLLSSSLLVEAITGWPGLGTLFLDAVTARDVHLIIAPVVLSAAFLTTGSLIADLLLYACDPRIRVEK